MTYSWLSLIPVLIVFISAFTTRHVIASLIAGIISAALIIKKGALVPSLVFIIQQLTDQLLNLDHCYTFGFLILLGIFIQVMTHSGGIASYTATLQKYLTDARSAQTMSLLISTTFFLDDYLNTLLTGAIMRPLFDFYHVSRVKLAFLLNSMSSPLCVIIPATSWAALILGQLQLIGVKEAFSLYISSIPFTLYPLAIIFSAWFIVRSRITYGPMRPFEKEERNLEALQIHPGSISQFLTPIFFFIGMLLINFFFSSNLWLIGGNASFQQALNTVNIFWILFISIMSTLLFSLLFFSGHKKLTSKAIRSSFLEGFLLMKNSLLLLILAWTLGTLLKDHLYTGHYLATLLLTSLSIKVLPFLLFIITTLISAATGSAWGSLVIMIPLGLPLAINTSLFLLPLSCGAILAGAVAGAHFSPISDATVMASTSAGCPHVDHVQTQISYSLPAFIASSIILIILGFLTKLPYAVAAIGGPLSTIILTFIFIKLCKHFL